MRPGDPIISVGKKGPTDWIAHKCDGVTEHGLAVVKCNDKGARRAITLAPGTERLVHWCVACWTDVEIATRRG